MRRVLAALLILFDKKETGHWEAGARRRPVRAEFPISPPAVCTYVGTFSSAQLVAFFLQLRPHKLIHWLVFAFKSRGKNLLYRTPPEFVANLLETVGKKISL
jgi:hypothetical protein